MRPQRSRDTGRAARVARGRLLVKADLAWLGGYPTAIVGDGGLAWCVPPGLGRPARTTTVDRAALHRSTRALTELERSFADLLGDIVEAPATWLPGARRAIAILKPIVHGRAVANPVPPLPGGAALAAEDVPVALAATIRALPAAWRAAIDAAAWMAIAAPGLLPRAVAFAAAHPEVAGALATLLPPAEVTTTLVHLTLLAEQQGARRVGPLARLLGDCMLHASPTSGVDYARALSRDPLAKRPSRPGASVGPALAAWTTTLLTSEPRARRATLALLEVVELPLSTHDWTAWWARVARCERLALGEPEPDRVAQVRGKATRLADGAPRPVHGASLTSLLTTVLGWDEATHREALRALRELPPYESGVPLRLAMLEHWGSVSDDVSPRKMAPLLGAFARYLQRTRSSGARALAPWAKVLDRQRRTGWAPDDSLVRDVPAPKWPLFFDALALAVEEGAAADLEHVSRALLAVAPLVSDAGEALALARAMLPAAGWARGDEIVRMAHQLCGHEPALFGQAIAILGGAGEPDLLRGLEGIRRSAGDELARSSLLEASDVARTCGRLLAVLELVGHRDDADGSVAPTVDPPWLHAYPAWLAPSLRRLAAADVDAERLARRLLGDDVRAISVMRRELAHLESLAARPQGVSDRMGRRIENLRARVAAPRPATTGLRAHAVAKVERAARRAHLARITAGLEASVRRRLPAFLKLESEAPGWLLSPRTLAQLAPVVAFDPKMRALALRVLRRRADPPPWDLRDAPPNAVFVQRLTRSGLEMGPWMDGIGAVRVTTPGGKVLDLGLEDDPLEILDMGRHFSTCLTPGDINYFSTFANVADANKRVLFARDPDGQVVGRCLLALTEAGGMVVFHPYAHDASLGFDAIVSGFARELAERMRTLVVPSGEVPRLVAPDWYDDGAVDLGGRFPFLQDGSDFRRSLETVTPAAFAADARERFAPLPLGPLTLPLLVALPELAARPELLAPLVPALAAAEGLPIATVGRAVDLLSKTPEATVSARALVPRIVARLRESVDDHGWLQGAVASVAAAGPGDVLRLLRETRGRQVRSWADEHDHRRLEMAARAYDALHRPRLASTIYRLAASHAWSPAARKVLEARAAELEAALR